MTIGMKMRGRTIFGGKSRIEGFSGGLQEGIAKPERLGYGLHDDWFRRITQEHRLVYKVTDNTVRIAMCRYHYHA